MRVAPLKPSQCAWYLRPLLWLQRRHYGAVLTSALVWAREPRALLGMALMYGALDRKSSPLTPGLRSLVIVRVSQLNGCDFCVDLNAMTLMRRGASEGKVAALADWRDSPLFDTRERMALEYAEAVTLGKTMVDDGLFTRLAAEFDEPAIIALTALVAFQNMSTKFNAALDIPAQGFCRLPPSGEGAP